MAYNILKGNVEGSVDQHADQEINGVKIFKNTISASVFYDTDAQSPCATIKDVAITKIEGTRNGSIITYDSGTKATAQFDLVFDSESATLLTQNISALNIEGSAKKLRDIPSDQFVEKIRADFIDVSHGLHNVRGSLQVKAGHGVCNTDSGVSVDCAVNGGLSFRSKKLSVNPNNSLSISTDGQNLSDSDKLLVFDESRDATYNTTLSNLCNTYMRAKLPQPDGPPGSIQIKSSKGFQSSTNLSYNINEDILNVGGQLVTDSFKVGRSMTCDGSVVMNISTTKDKEYHVQSDDYTILADTSDSAITVTLPPACNNAGRILIIKKINSNRFKLNSHQLKVNVLEGLIDFQTQITIKNNYATRTVQSDGENWWLISKVGS